jgi:PAS domain S-box-containing protein
MPRKNLPPPTESVLEAAINAAERPPLSQLDLAVGRPRGGARVRVASDLDAARACLLAIAALAAVGAALCAVLPLAIEPTTRLLLVAANCACAIGAAAALLLPRERLGSAAVLALVACVAVVTLLAAAGGDGARSSVLALLAVLSAAACFVAGARGGAVVAGAGVVAVALLQFAVPKISGNPAPPPEPALMVVLAIGAGLLTGLGFARVVARRTHSAAERELRFSGLLAIAADAYWEVDPRNRLRAVTTPRDAARESRLAKAIGKVPWDLPAFVCDAETLDALQADVEARVPFRDVPVAWRSREGTLRHFVLSGEPRFDERGFFVGYWGVARETTEQVQASQALAATETRYQELFTRIPSPLLLHRGGLVLDANPAALQLMGYESLQAIVGRDVLDHYESGDSRERERRRLEELEDKEIGEALPIADFKMRALNGRRLTVRATGVRVAGPGGPATLSIFVDDTERRRTEDAVRRSEALLQHLVATSPDLIILADLATGRFAMVNATFEQMTGYPAAEAVGATADELGLWPDTTVRESFLKQLGETGLVREFAAEFVSKSGQAVQLLLSGAVFVMDHRNYLVINGRDITEQERSRRVRDAILEHASIGIAVSRHRGFVLTNPRFDQMYGWPRGGLLGQPVSASWPSEDEYAAVVAEVGSRLVRGEAVEFERTARRRDGSTFLARVIGKGIDPQHAARGTVWIVEDVTERHQVREALARARDEAEAASRAKSAFLANTSHELRTPLNGMLGLARLARDPSLDESRRRVYLDQIAETARSLAAIISDVLDLSKIEAGHFEVESAVFDLRELVSSIGEAYAALAAGRNLSVEVDIPGDLASHVQGDALRLRQILSNYLSNALKFTERGSVRVVVRRLDAQRVRFEVRDSGPGLDAATQARLFRPFTQADESTTRRFGGTGLGLAICRELAQLMGGSVGVISKPGRGACFWAELPLPAVAAREAPEPVVADAGDLRGVHVLLVEDNPVNMLIAVAMLERWGATVEQVTDGRQAVAAVERSRREGRHFDAVLMDVQMPVMSGFEATRELRRLGNGERLPIIALTAAALVSERDEAYAAGMDDFLTKPIDPDRLRAVLTRMVRAPVSD